MQNTLSRLGALIAALALNIGVTTANDSLLIPDFLPKEYNPIHSENLEELPLLNSALHSFAAWNDIKNWRMLGGRFAAALDDKNHVIAIYDLSATNVGVLERVRLGRVGGPNFRLSQVRELLASYSPYSSGKQAKLADEALQKLDELGRERLERSLLPPDWFSRIPWRRPSLAAQTGAPESFTLSDIDFKRLVSSPGLFFKSVDYLGRFGIHLDRIGYFRQADGTYTIELMPGRVPLAHGRPIKIVDVKSKYAGFIEQLQWEIGRAVVSFAVAQIPVPIVSALVSTALGKTMTYHRDVTAHHRESALELLNTAETDGGRFSPFSTLSPEERKRAGVGIYLSGVSIFSMWKLLFKGAESAWRDNLKIDARRAGEARIWLAKNSEELFDLSPRFGATLEKNAPRRLYVLSHSRPSAGSRPFVALDYRSPDHRLVERIAIETTSTIVSFASSFIPIIGSVVAMGFDAIVRAPVQYSKEWEARLMAHLEERERVSQEDWHRELSMLARQRVNPLELPPAQARVLIEHYRKELGI